MKREFKVISPVDGRIVTTIPEASPSEIARTLDASQKAQAAWRHTTLQERMDIVERFVLHMEANAESISELLTLQMGRPISQSPGEIRGLAERARYMASAAPAALGDLQPPEKEGFQRFVRREPLGVVLVLAPWNYPYLTAVNAVVPALLAGNSVILKHSDQTPLAAEHFREGRRHLGPLAGLRRAARAP